MARVDRRVRKTEASIKKAFEELAVLRKLNDITVKDLTDRADINRKTFYLHYDSIENLVDSYVDNISKELIGIFKQHSFKEYYEKPGEALIDLSNTLKDKKGFWLKILFSDEYSYFSRKIEKKLVKNMTIFMLKYFSTSELDAKMCANFLVQNTLSTTRFLIYDLNCEDFSLVKAQVGRLNKFGISSFFKG